MGANVKAKPLKLLTSLGLKTFGLGSLICLGSCGKNASSLANSGSLGTLETKSSGASQSYGPGIQIKLDGYKSGDVSGSSAAELALYTVPVAIDLSQESADQILQGVSTQLRVAKPDAKIVVETKSAGKKTWTVAGAQEGKFIIEFVANHQNTSVVNRFPVTKIIHYFDRTPPEMSATAAVSADTVSGIKKVMGHVQFFDSSPTNCQANIENSANASGEKLTLEIKDFSEEPLPAEKGNKTLKLFKKQFTLENIPASFASQLLLRIKCEDLAKNSSESTYNVSAEPQTFSLKSNLLAKLAPLPEDANTQIKYIGAKGVRLQNELIDPSSGIAMHSSVGEVQKDLIKISISKISPADSVSFKTHAETYFFSWKQDFEQAFPGSFLGRQDFFVGLWKRNKDKTETLVNFEKFDVYYDTSAPTVTQWADIPKAINPAQNMPLPFGFQVSSTGAKADPSSFRLEGTSDDISWTPINSVAITLNTNTGFYEGVIPYPFSDQRNFKVRVLGQDFSLNAFVSNTSPLLVEKQN